MSCPSPNDSIKKKENDELEDEDKNIAKYILELKNEETRNEAIKNLFCYYMKHEELGFWRNNRSSSPRINQIISMLISIKKNKR